MVCSSSPALGPSGPARVLPSVGAPGGQGLAVNTTVDPEESFGSRQTLSSGKRSLSGMLWAATRGSAERSRIRGRGPRVDDDNPAPGEGTLPWTRQPPSSVRRSWGGSRLWARAAPTAGGGVPGASELSCRPAARTPDARRSLAEHQRRREVSKGFIRPRCNPTRCLFLSTASLLGRRPNNSRT